MRGVDEGHLCQLWYACHESWLLRDRGRGCLFQLIQTPRREKKTSTKDNYKPRQPGRDGGYKIEGGDVVISMDDDDDVYYYIRWRLKLEGETENMGVCTKERKGVTAAVHGLGVDSDDRSAVHDDDVYSISACR